MDQPALFSEPPARTFTLSAMLAREASKGALVTWRKLTRHDVTCDECLAVQHETSGKSGPRSPARVERRVNAASLYLCWTHANLWKERDDA